MTSYRGLHISRNQVNQYLSDFTTMSVEAIESSCECKNINQGQYRYNLIKDDISFYIDCYFTKNNSTTLMSTGELKNQEIGNECCIYIENLVEYKEVKNISFSYDNVEHEIFTLLIEYLNEQQGVKQICNEDKGQNGHIIKYLSDIGDKITLTFYVSTNRLMFQGCVMKLYTEVKCFMAAYKYLDISVDKGNINDIETFMSQNLPCSYGNITPILQELICDSVKAMKSGVSFCDYSVVTFSCLKALEGRIKEILQWEGIKIPNKSNFCINNNGDYTKIFSKNSLNKFELNYISGIIEIKDVKIKTTVEECYTYYYKNRNELSHMCQTVQVSRAINDIKEAEYIIVEVCKLFEQSYNAIGK